MKTSILYLIMGLLVINSLNAQVKIGDNPQNLDPASLLELQSNNRVLVITRVTDAQMGSINPLQGALVYNTDQECLHYYDGTEWINICEELDNSFTVSTRPDYFSTINPAQSKDSTVVISQTVNADGSINYNYEVGLIRGANIVNTTINGDSKLQDESVTNRKLADEAVALDNLEGANNAGDLFMYTGSAWNYVNRSDLLNTQLDSIVGNEVVGPFDTTLELFGNGVIGDPYTLDVSEGGITDYEIATDAVTTDEILDGTIATNDIANDAVTNAKLDKANIPLSGFGAAEADIDLDGNRLINLADPTVALDAVNLQYLEAAIIASEAADNDTDDTNELSDIQLSTTTLELTNPAAGATGVDLDPIFATDTELANAITASEAADNDTDDTNELSDIQLSTTTLELTNPAAGATGVDLDPTFATDTELANAITASEAADNDTDDTNELSDIQLSTTTLELTNSAAGATGVDLDLTFATDTELANAITASETADNDTDDQNELQDLDLTTNILTLSSPATPGNQVNLTPYLDDTTLAINNLTQTDTDRTYDVGTLGTLSFTNGSVGIGTTSPPTSTLQTGGSFSAPITRESSNISLNETHYTVILETGVTSVTLPAPNVSNTGRIYILKNRTGGVVNTNINYIDSAGASISTINNVVIIQSDGAANWEQIN